MNRLTRSSPGDANAPAVARKGGASGAAGRHAIHSHTSTPDRSPHHNLSPNARARLQRLGLGDETPAAELRAGRIVASILTPCRLHLHADGRLFVELPRRAPGAAERITHHAGGAQFARAIAAGGGR